MSVQAITAYVEEYLPEDELLLAARANAAEVGAATPVTPAVGAALRFVAAAINAKSVVEIGTGCGVSGIWLLRGMRRDSVLTSVDVDPEHQRLARKAFMDAGFPANRCRLITGKAADVLPRLTDGGYDLVFCDADRQDFPEHLTAAMRLLRPGGVVVFNGALWDGLAADPDSAGPEASAVAEVREQIRQDERLVPLLMPLADGLLTAVKRI